METLILQELRAVNGALNLGYEIFYWHTSNHVEVDFVLYGEKGIVAIESKSSQRLTSDMFRGLKAFKTDYPMAKTYLIYGGTRREYRDDIQVIGVQEFLQSLAKVLKN